MKRSPLKRKQWGERARRNGIRVPKRVPDDVLQRVVDRDHGRCVVCGLLCHDYPHHVLPKASYRHLTAEADNLVTVCLSPCHARHETAHRRIPRSALPVCVFALAEREGPRAVAYLERTYP